MYSGVRSSRTLLGGSKGSHQRVVCHRSCNDATHLDAADVSGLSGKLSQGNPDLSAELLVHRQPDVGQRRLLFGELCDESGLLLAGMTAGRLSRLVAHEE